MKLNFLRSVALATACLAVGIALGRHWGAAPAAPAPHLAVAPPKDSYQFFDTLVDIRSQILRNYVEPVNDQKLLNGAIQGMMKTLDPYSNYFGKNELASFDRIIHGQFSGIGAEFAQDTNGNYMIVSPLEDSPALKAGIYAGDRVLKINGEATADMSLKTLHEKIEGAPGTTLVLTVRHEGEKTPVDLTVTRAVVQVLSVRGVRHMAGTGEEAGAWDFLIDPAHRIAYVRISSFMEATPDELDKALLPLIRDQENGSLKGIILDLRFNPGGLLEAGIAVCNRFLDSGVIVSTGRPDSAKRDFIAEATKAHTYPRIPLVVLINEYSASASEIVAGALQDHHRAVLIGARTFGKGSVQSLLSLDNGNAALKLTTAYYYLPSGRNIMRKKGATTWGVQPDPAFNMPLTDAENRQVLINRSKSELIRRAPAATGAATAPASANGAAAAGNAAPATPPPVEATDRQLQRALEVLIAYQALGPGRDFTADVTTTSPAASASLPAEPVNPATPKPEPATAPATRPGP